MAPRVIVYAAVDVVGENLRFMAYHVGPKGAILPVRFNGPTEEAVRATADKWWTEESARQAKIKGGPKAIEAPATPADKIKEGLTEALAVAKGEAQPARVTTFEDLI